MTARVSRGSNGQLSAVRRSKEQEAQQGEQGRGDKWTKRNDKKKQSVSVRTSFWKRRRGQFCVWGMELREAGESSAETVTGRCGVDSLDERSGDRTGGEVKAS